MEMWHTFAIDVQFFFLSEFEFKFQFTFPNLSDRSENNRKRSIDINLYFPKKNIKGHTILYLHIHISSSSFAYSALSVCA